MTLTDRRHSLGLVGEDHAAKHFRRLGFDVLAQRYRTRYGEIDLIVADESLLVFAEVKTRRVGSGRPFDSLGEVKQLQVRRMGAAWLSESGGRFYEALRFDAVGVIVTPVGGLVELEHLEGAF